MRCLLRRAALVLAFVFLPLASACGGGDTGLEVHLKLPSDYVPGVTFNQIRAQVEVEGDTFGAVYDVTEQTEQPYRFFILVGERARQMGSLKVELILNEQGRVEVKKHLIKPVKFEDGEVTDVLVDLT